MPLRGTLKDFGIADIFQLIGHQAKTGLLTARNRAQRVTIHFVSGSIVHAEAEHRQWQDLLGNMLVRAEVISQAQLDEALAVQKETKQRLGDILSSKGFVDIETLRTFAKLQTTETVYQLFLWSGGSYEFVQADVRVPPGSEAVRSEQILMEGFRQVDEWPGIRKKITGYNVGFRVLEDLDKLVVAQGDTAESDDIDLDGLDGLDGAFGELEGKPSTAGDERLRRIGENERIVYRIIEDGRDVQKIIDLARLGEFETCKALANLVDAMIITPSTATTSRRPSATSALGGISAGKHGSRFGYPMQVCVVAVLLAAVWYGAKLSGVDLVELFVGERPIQYVDLSLQSMLSRGQVGHIRSALEVYKAATGIYPDSLRELVDGGLLRYDDLRFPWETEYYYKRDEDGYDLLRPLF